MRLHCENDDDDDVDEDYDNNGLPGAQKIFSMKRSISKSYTKTEQNGGCSSVNYYNYDYDWTTTKTASQGVARKLIWKYSGTLA